LAESRCDISRRGKVESIGFWSVFVIIAAAGHGERHTCHTKGKFFRFASANRIAAILQRPPGALNAVHFARVAMSFARSVDCVAIAAIDTPAMTMLRACAIVTMPG
jgi:hypothetical protein